MSWIWCGGAQRWGSGLFCPGNTLMETGKYFKVVKQTKMDDCLGFYQRLHHKQAFSGFNLAQAPGLQRVESGVFTQRSRSILRSPVQASTGMYRF